MEVGDSGGLLTMGWRTSPDNPVNRPPVPAAWRSRILDGQAALSDAIGRALAGDADRLGRPCLLALDGYKGAKFDSLVDGVRRVLEAEGLEVETVDANGAYRSPGKIEALVGPYLAGDPSFGRVYPGDLESLLDPDKVAALASGWEALRRTGNRRVVICHGAGAAVPRLRPLYDRVAYLDLTRRSSSRAASGARPHPWARLATERPHWKRAYYVEYPVLNRHKKRVLRDFDWYVESCREESPKLAPADVYRALMTELSGMPLSFKVFYMPGTFGGMEFGERFNVPGLPNSSWCYEVSVGDSHLLVDPGDGRVLEIPLHNLIFEAPLRPPG
jgi:hypothetical protein